jgi:hypothetical protein
MGPLEAENCAALAALHLLQALDAAVLTARPLALPAPPAAAAADVSAVGVDAAAVAAASADVSAMEVDTAAASSAAAAGADDAGLLSGVELLWPGRGGGLLQPQPGLFAQVGGVCTLQYLLRSYVLCCPKDCAVAFRIDDGRAAKVGHVDTLIACMLLLCCAVLCCAVLCCAVLCCAVLCCAVLCCAVLCCAVLCCAVLCCAV